jgi:hypothetical protein
MFSRGLQVQLWRRYCLEPIQPKPVEKKIAALGDPMFATPTGWGACDAIRSRYSTSRHYHNLLTRSGTRDFFFFTQFLAEAVQCRVYSTGVAFDTTPFCHFQLMSEPNVDTQDAARALSALVHVLTFFIFFLGLLLSPSGGASEPSADRGGS